MDKHFDEDDFGFSSKDPAWNNEDMNVDEDQEDYDSDELRRLEMDIYDKQLRKEVLDSAISICKNNWFWKFTSLESKLASLTSAYLTMMSLIQNK